MMDESVRRRNAMVDTQIMPRGIHTPRVLEAMRSVPRHLFLTPEMLPHAYSDCPLPIGCSQTISQPYIVALMTDLLQLEGDETVLEIGTGSGYQAAVLACLAKTVHTLERHETLAEEAAHRLAELGYENVHVHTGDGTLGWPEAAPYACILVTAAAPRPPEPLLDQLAEGGRLVIPVGSWGTQILQVWKKKGKELDCEDVLAVAFVPLRGQHGWKDGEW
jgi:protein-L-isoaspartate(D-aspartate) O-methyltransferase